MEFTSILDEKESPYKEKTRPSFFRDLNLDQVIERIRLDWGEEVSSYYFYFPADAGCEDYRREVFSDMGRDGLYDDLCAFHKAMKGRREASVRKGEVKSVLQKAVWHLREAGCYCEAFGGLSRCIGEKDLRSRGMQAFRSYLQRYLAGEDYREMQEAAAGLLADLEAFRLVLTYENDKIVITAGEVEGTYDTFLESRFPGHGKSLASPFLSEIGLVELEESLLKAFRKRNPDFFSGVTLFSEKYEIYADAVLIRFASEIGFYLSFYRFEKKMQERGFCFCKPFMADSGTEERKGNSSGTGRTKENGSGTGRTKENGSGTGRTKENGSGTGGTKENDSGTGGTKENDSGTGGTEENGPEAGETEGEMYARDLYDLALACAGKDVVTNDMILRPGERFFLLTGPNQGGKTTFARSLGQLVYFAKMGLDVPASSAKIYRFTDILTHFCVEESVETGRGKLREELERLANMMAASLKEQTFLFVVINELFTTAANYDACIMGKRVLDHFLNRGCRGIYVTHLSELAGEDPRLVSLRATLDEEGRRTFLIERSREDTPADAGSLVGKHGLTYEQLKERLA